MTMVCTHAKHYKQLLCAVALNWLHIPINRVYLVQFHKGKERVDEKGPDLFRSVAAL